MTMRIAMTLLIAACLASGVLSAPDRAMAEDRVAVVTMDPGRYSKMIADKVRGFDTITYVIPAAAGQTIAVTFETNHRQSSFDVFGPDGGKLHDGEKAGLSWTGRAALSGQYAARVLLARSAANRGEQATYRISVAITGEPIEGAEPPALAASPQPTDATPAAAGDATTAPDPAAPASSATATAEQPALTPPAVDPTAAPDAADAEVAAAPAATETPPDPAVEEMARSVAGPAADIKDAAKFWAVTGVPPRGVLPVYKQPGVEASRIGRLPHDATNISNLGCRMVGGARWCRVELKGEVEQDGWVAGRYLRETSGRPASDQPSSSVGVRPLRNITGVVACSQSGATKPLAQCEARVQRAAPGLAVVYATMPDGATRVFNFNADGIFVTNPDLTLDWTLKGTNFEIVVNGRELLVIPQQVIGVAEPAPDIAAEIVEGEEPALPVPE